MASSGQAGIALLALVAIVAVERFRVALSAENSGTHRDYFGNKICILLNFCTRQALLFAVALFCPGQKCLDCYRQAAYPRLAQELFRLAGPCAA